MANAYRPNQPVNVQASFSVAGVLTDPTTVTVTVRDPKGAVTTYTLAGGTVTRDSVGAFHVTLTPVTPGRWYYSVNSTGVAAADDEQFFTVIPSALA